MNCMNRNRIIILAAFLTLVFSTSVFAQATIKASVSPKKGGSISPSGKIEATSGEFPQFIITPNTGYEIKDVIVDGVSQGAINIYTFTDTTQNHSVKAKFAKKICNVEIAQGRKVKVSPEGTRTVPYGKKIKLKIKPESEDVIPILLVNGEPVETVKSGNIYNYTLTPVGDTSVYATSEVETVLTAAAKVMDETTAQNLASISEDGTVLTFSGLTPYLESVQPNDVIICGVTEATPYGLLRKVTNITINGSEVIVETTDATLEDAIQEAEIMVSQELTANDIASFVPLLEGVTLEEPLPGPVRPQGCLNFSSVFYDADGDKNTSDDQVRLGGSACLSPSLNFILSIGYDELGIFPYLDYLLFSIGMSESISLELIANVSTSFGGEIPVAWIPFYPIVVGPLVIIPELTVYAGINCSISADLTTRVDQYAGFRAGLEYKKGRWSRINEHRNTYTTELPKFSTLGGHAQVYLKPEFDLLLFGFFGPYGDLKGYFDLEMYPFKDPWMILWGGMEVGVGVTVKPFGYKLADYRTTVLQYREKIKEFAGNKQPFIYSLTANPAGVFIGETSTVTLVAADAEGNPMTCTWSVTGGSLSSTTGCGSVTWTAPGTPGTCTRFGQCQRQLAGAHSGIAISQYTRMVESATHYYQPDGKPFDRLPIPDLHGHARGLGYRGRSPNLHMVSNWWKPVLYDRLWVGHVDRAGDFGVVHRFGQRYG